MIIDMHVHVTPSSQWEVIWQEMRNYGIDLAVVSSLGVQGWPHYPTATEIRAANDQAAQMVAASQGRAIWLAYLNPQWPNWREELTKCQQEGCRGIKLWVSLRDQQTGSLENTTKVLQTAAELKLPVLIHTFHRTDPLLPGEVSVLEVAAWGRQFPNLTLIAAHAGCNWRQARGILREVPNVLVDVCGGMPEQGMLETLVEELGAERVMYGSDAYGRSFPSQLAKVWQSNLPAPAQEKILSANAKRVFRISEAELRQAQDAAATLSVTRFASALDLSEDHFLFAGDLPFVRNPYLTVRELSAALQTQGVKRAYCASGKSLYALDLLQENRLWAAEAQKAPDGCLQPLATMLPTVFNWREVLQEAGKLCRGGIIFPYLHDWNLNDPQFEEFFAACAQERVPLWINVNLHDMRFRPRGIKVRPTASSELVDFMARAPANQYVVQGANADMMRAALRLQRNDLRFEISRLVDNTGALKEIVEEFGVEKLVGGSEFPIRDLQTNKMCAEWISQPNPRKLRA